MESRKTIKIKGIENGRISGIQKNTVVNLGIATIDGERFLATLPTREIIQKVFDKLNESPEENAKYYAGYHAGIEVADIEFLRYQSYSVWDRHTTPAPVHERVVAFFSDDDKLWLESMNFPYTANDRRRSKTGTTVMLMPLKEDGETFDVLIQQTTEDGTIANGGVIHLNGKPKSFREVQGFDYDVMQWFDITIQDDELQQGYQTLPWMVIDGCLVSLVPIKGLFETSDNI